MKAATLFSKRINWVTSFFIALFHVCAVIALFNFTWPAFVAMLVLYFISGCFGIGLGYHRLLTHRGFTVPKPVEYFFAICGTLALQGGPIFWVGLHRIHHAKSDREGDPHSPRDGFFWSHMGWVLYGDTWHDIKERANRFNYAPDLAKQPFYVWLTQFHYVPQVIVALILLGIGGWPMVLWGVFMRTTLTWHTTWFVNSATHVWGYQRFKSNDGSRNNWWVALLAFGEGWHNNHHAHAASARHGLTWYEFDLNWIVIRILELIGIAKDVRTIELATAPRKLSDEADDRWQMADVRR